MTPDQIAARLRRIDTEVDLCVRAQRVAMLVSDRFRAVGLRNRRRGRFSHRVLHVGRLHERRRGHRLCRQGTSRTPPDRRGPCPAGRSTGSIRTFKVGGIFVDVLGELDTWANTPLREMRGDDGGLLRLIQPEDLLPHRLLVATYPTEQPSAMAAARKLLAVCRSGKVEIYWDELRRVAELPAYQVGRELDRLLGESPDP